MGDAAKKAEESSEESSQKAEAEANAADAEADRAAQVHDPRKYIDVELGVWASRHRKKVVRKTTRLKRLLPRCSCLQRI